MPPRTSKSHPIRVDFLDEDLAGMPGRLGMTFAPGKTAPSRYGRPWDRDLWSDLSRLASQWVYDVDALVTTVEEQELRDLGIEDLFEDASRHGIDVYWYPTADGHPPGSEEAVRAMVDHIWSRVYGGQTVVVHCKGGLGRTGTLVACCLRALEYEPEEAIRLVREARRGAVETRAQREFVRDFRSGWTPWDGPSLLSHFIWTHLEHADDFGEPEPGDYAESILSASEDADPAIRYFPAGQESWGVDVPPEPVFDPTEEEVIRACAERFEGGGTNQRNDEEQLEARRVERLDGVVDAAVCGEALEATPTEAGRALERLVGRVDPYTQWHTLYEDDLPHLRDGARRLFLRATDDGAAIEDDATGSPTVWEQRYAPRLEKLRDCIRSKVRGTSPLTYVQPAGRLQDAMDTAALRFDGYRYREGRDRAIWFLMDYLQTEGDYRRVGTKEMASVFFLLQRGLRKWGMERVGEHSPERRVYRELFVRLWDVDIPREWAMPAAADFYDLWRWGVGPVARPFAARAREELAALAWSWRR